ncbi:hypothetical protein OTU49_008256 [Cherax quadricarinatus]|uniref:Protein kinase domain-containing protein n=1 Tax=Cherax quadricarinatus TaxID=27406 RepID=A0AAW0WQA6_CHEQU
MVSCYAGEILGSFLKHKMHTLVTKLQVMLQVHSIMQRIVEKGFVHNDIKANNICILNGNVTFIDFGFGCRFGKVISYEDNCEETKRKWYAPEIRKGKPCSEASDIFSLGTLWSQYFRHKSLPTEIHNII